MDYSTFYDLDLNNGGAMRHKGKAKTKMEHLDHLLKKHKKGGKIVQGEGLVIGGEGLAVGGAEDHPMRRIGLAYNRAGMITGAGGKRKTKYEHTRAELVKMAKYHGIAVTRGAHHKYTPKSKEELVNDLKKMGVYKEHGDYLEQGAGFNVNVDKLKKAYATGEKIYHTGKKVYDIAKELRPLTKLIF